MKILVKANSKQIEQFEIINYLANLGHQIKHVDVPLYLECTRVKYDFIALGEEDLNEEVKQLCNKYSLGTLLVSDTEINIFSKNSQKLLNIGRFANIFKYKVALADPSISSDIYIHCDNPEYFNKVQHIDLDKKIKITSNNILHCANFVGIPTLDEIVKLAKSAEITYGTNQVLIDSLLYNNICAFHIKMFFTISDSLDKEQYISEQQKLIQPITKIAELLNEELSSINR